MDSHPVSHQSHGVADGLTHAPPPDMNRIISCKILAKYAEITMNYNCLRVWRVKGAYIVPCNNYTKQTAADNHTIHAIIMLYKLPHNFTVLCSNVHHELLPMANNQESINLGQYTYKTSTGATI